MNRFVKIIVYALLLSAIPAKIWAQDYKDYESGFLFNVFEIANVEERVQLASALATSEIWLCNPTDNPGELYIRPNSYHADIPIYAEFDYLRTILREEYEEASSLPKEEFIEIFNSWVHNLSSDYYNFLISDHLDRANHCMDAEPFCTNNIYNFPALNSGYSWSGPNYGCLGSSPTSHHSFWYYMRIGVAGNITIKIEASFDVDFALWGPFNDQTDPCPTTQGQAGLLTAGCTSCPDNTTSPNFYPSGNLHDCSFDIAHYEYAHVVNGQVGQYFILLITNWSGISGNITFQKHSGNGETDCNIMPPVVDNNGPYCVGQTIQLTANGQAGATYAWTGPGGFTSTQQNPTLTNCTMAMAGTYTCTITLDGQTSSAETEVEVYPQPTANFTATNVCQGNATQFVSASTTNPTGQSITSYEWDFGDGQTGTGQSVSHTYAQAGTYTATLTVATEGGICTSEKTKTVTVYASPIADAGPDQTIAYGATAQLSGSAGATGNYTYHWEPANMVTNANTQNPQTVALTATQTYTLTVTNPQGNCTSSDQVTIHINGGAMSVSATARPYTICSGNSTQLNANAGGGTGNFSYSWAPTTGLNDPHISNPVASPTRTTTYTCTVNDGQTTQTANVTITVIPLPDASFTATSVCQGEATQFTCTTPGQMASYEWDFGDGRTGTGQTTNHTYNRAGTYQVTLTVHTAEGNCSDDITQTVTVVDPPVARFTATNVCQGNATQFNSTTAGQGLRYQWSFGDGQTGTGQNPSHTYAQAGTYEATLTVQTSNGACSDDITKNVSVYATPVASASAQPSTVLYGANTTLTANAGTQGVFNFHWEPANLVANPNAQTTQTLGLQESQTFTVTITNPQGDCSSTAQVTVSLEGSGMVAMASADQTDLCDGETTVLHALPSGGTGNYTYSWTPANSLSNPNSPNPTASPSLGNNTYTCHVSDSYSDINVSVTLHVHPNVEKDIYQTICPDDYYSFFGQDLQTPGVYNYTLNTQYGCDSTINLHLDHWQTYETPITDHFCQGDHYTYYGETLDAGGVYYHTLHSTHGCDSVIRLNLIQDPSYEFEFWESTCQGGDGYYFAGEYWQPRPEVYVFPYTTTHQHCDSIIYLHIAESAYNSKNYNVSICDSQYTWPSNGKTYYDSGIYYDTLHYPNTCDSTVVLNLDLRPSYNEEVVISSCDTYRWKNDTYNVDKTFEQSTVYTHHYMNTFGCESEVTLYLTINDHDESSFTVSEEENCDKYYWDPKGHEIVYTDHEGLVYNMSGTYQRIYKNQSDCDSIVTMNVQFEYTPHPTEIYPMDADNTAPHWVITASEFQINSYDFNLWDINPNCHWDTVTWVCEGAPNWVLEPFGDKAKCCKLYVLDKVEDTVWLTAHAFNRCAPQDGILQRYWMVCSFYGLEENDPSIGSRTVDFNVVPNPNNGQMTLNFEHFTGSVNVKVYDMRGSLIDSFETHNSYGPSSCTYRMKNKVSGVYFFVVTGKEGTLAKKVVVH